SHHEGVDHRAQYGLQQQQHRAHWTLVSDDPVAVADGGLRLNGEQEGGDEAVQVVHTRSPRLILQVVQVPPLHTTLTLPTPPPHASTSHYIPSTPHYTPPHTTTPPPHPTTTPPHTSTHHYTTST